MGLQDWYGLIQGSKRETTRNSVRIDHNPLLIQTGHLQNIQYNDWIPSSHY
jgi:hypothetical protein